MNTVKKLRHYKISFVGLCVAALVCFPMYAFAQESTPISPSGGSENTKCCDTPVTKVINGRCCNGPNNAGGNFDPDCCTGQGGRVAGAELGTDSYDYAYDNIGNRKTADEAAVSRAYTSNNLNQYSSITKAEEAPFVPSFDARRQSNQNQDLHGHLDGGLRRRKPPGAFRKGS